VVSEVRFPELCDPDATGLTEDPLSVALVQPVVVQLSVVEVL
jgi:hypothetical protein